MSTLRLPRPLRWWRTARRCIDVGGESTRPGATPVEETEELRRVIPIVERLVSIGTIVSVDTSKPLVARAAIDAGAHLINDVRALTDPGVLRAVAASDVAVCLMHMRGEPPTMQKAPHYENVVEEVRAYLSDRACACCDAGISRERIAIDPGFGFGKTLRAQPHVVAPAERTGRSRLCRCWSVCRGKE